ncbi:hypothetical protein KA107_02255 [Candidatus Pacearchaeota archaeon]|nr:hypothetical protein [Candidatus Pacearchaeota archaeon]
MEITQIERERNMQGVYLVMQELVRAQENPDYSGFEMRSSRAKNHRRKSNGLHHMLELQIHYRDYREDSRRYGRYEHESKWFRLNSEWERVGKPLTLEAR